MAVDKNFYNEASSAKLGWAPWDFVKGHTNFDDTLQEAIKTFQKNYNLLADGMCGPTTYRRLVAHLESQQQVVIDQMVRDGSDVLWYNNQPIAIDWPKDKVHTFKDQNFPYAISGGLTKYTGSGKREIKSFVNHWDVCLNSKSCAKVLARRNVSVHFCIDNDGSIIQLHDINDMCWHAGNRNVNRTSVGVEISNAYYPKYQGWYKKNVGKERPIMSGALAQNKKLDDFLWFYPEQIEALKALWKAIHEGCGVPLAAPDTKWAYDSSCARGSFRGFMSHFHCSKKKIDVGGLDIEKLLKEIEE